MLTWNEIRTNAARFAERWADAEKENAEAQTFWNEFLAVYGVDRRRVAAFERKVKGLEKGSGRGRIDLLWSGLFMAEHKSKGRDLEAATGQALEYVQVLEEHERPQWVAVSDFGQVRLHEVATGQAEQFPLADLPRQVERFAFLIGKQLRHQREADPVNVKAAQQMGKLHNLLENSGYTGHALEMLLVRLLFLLFGDDTGLWDERGLFYDLLADHTRSNGEDTGSVLGRLFQVLDTPTDRRQANLPDWLNAFPYVNGELFSERIDLADFSPKMRQMLLDACTLDWGAVSPAIFGSMFQAVMDATERRNLGAHYTSEVNILKALGPLFLDELQAMREAARGNKSRLQQLLDLLPRLRFLDPACGSGNFLLLAYRELRRLELDVLAEQQKGQQVLDVAHLIRVNVGQFYGIECDEFPAQIARVAMWLADHQANIEASRTLGQNFVNLPLTQAAHIRHGDALEVDWLTHMQLEKDAADLRGVYVVGNPPFIGASLMKPQQRLQILSLFHNVHNATELDYVTGWHVKSAKMMNFIQRQWPHVETKTALVSTNSIVQGEQVAPLWNSLLRDQRQVITAAHQTFQWSNDAPGQAAVHCVITQFQPAETAPAGCTLFTYSRPKAAPIQQPAKFINAYLVDGPDVIVTKRSGPFSQNPRRMSYGNKPTDNGHLIFQTREEYEAFLRDEPDAARFIKPMLDAHDFINGKTRWCLWLPQADPADLRKLPRVMERVQKVKAFRLNSTAAPTRKTAETPTKFFYVSHPNGPYVAVPRHTSANREYVPLGYLDQNTIINDAMCLVADADLFLFGVMQSRLHMDWMRLVSGRLKSDYRYSPQVTYNTFPWPDRNTLLPKQVQAVEKAAGQVLEARKNHQSSTLADLYDPLTMPADLRAAHNALDGAVDVLYGLKVGSTEAQRLALLLTRYQEQMPTLESQAKPEKTRRKGVGILP